MKKTAKQAELIASLNDNTREYSRQEREDIERKALSGVITRIALKPSFVGLVILSLLTIVRLICT